MGRSKSLKKTMPSVLSILKRFWPYIRQYPSLIVGAFTALFATTAFRLLEPWPLKYIFDVLLTPSTDAGDAATSGGRLQSLDPMTLLAACAVAVVAIVGLRATCDYLARVCFFIISLRVLARVRSDLFRHLQNLSLSFHTNSRSGDTLVRVMSDTRLLRDMASTAIMPLIASLLVFAGMWGLMFFVQWKLALVAAAVLPVFWLVARVLSRRIRRSARKFREREGVIAATATESLNAIKLVQALSLESKFSAAFDEVSNKSLKQDLRGSRMSAKLQRTVDLLRAIALALVLWFGVRFILIDKSMSPGDLLVFLAYLRRGFNPMQDVAKYTSRLAKAAAAGERVLDLFDREPEICDAPNASPAPTFRGDLRFENVHFAYGKNQPVLEGMNFSIPAGSTTALVGQSGIGKSTITDLVLRFYDPSDGRVLIDHCDIRDFSLESLRRQVAVVLQDSVLFAVSVRENIALGGIDVSDEEVEQAARLAQAHDFIEAMSEGYDTVLGERGVTLSAGQRQRLAIARAAVRDAPIVIYDEATTGLDEENERLVIASLERLSRDRTTLLVTHDLGWASRADMILYLEGGVVCESGTHEELVQQGGRYASLYRLQSAELASPDETESNHALAF